MAQSPLPLPGVSQPAPAAQPAAPAATPAVQPPHIDQAALVKKANEATGLDIDAKIKSWRDELDRIEQGMRDPKADYKALNDFRTELFKLRTDGEEFWKKLEPVLNSANDDVQALPAAPAQGEAPETEQAAIYRAETNAYHAYLTSTRGTLDGTQNRIGKLLGHLLDIRRSRVSQQSVPALPGSVFSRDLGSRAWTNPGAVDQGAQRRDCLVARPGARSNSFSGRRRPRAVGGFERF